MINRIASVIASVAIHAAVLWLYKPGDNNIPLAAGEPAGESVDVDLVEPGAAPEPAPAVEEMPPEPVPPELVPEEVTPPEPTPPPEPMPEPTPEPTPPPPDAIPEPTPPAPRPIEQPKPKPKPVAKPAPRPPPQTPRTGPVGGPVSAGAVAGSNAGSNDESHARYKHKVKVTYPPSLKKSGIQGRVDVVVLVSASGKTISAKVSRTSGKPLFDQAALAAARATEFYPKKTLGRAVEDTVLILYDFVLND